MNTSSLPDYILTTVTDAEIRLTPQALILQTCQKRGATPGEVKSAIRTLFDKGDLSYSYVFGATCIEPSFSKPVRITDHFILSPPGFPTTQEKDAFEISIRPGISFGSGRHPTTRLCLRAMEYALIKHSFLPSANKSSRAVDVGTGSGVLAIAAVKAGMGHCLALDNDPVAATEAEKNIAFNHLSDQITVSHRELSPTSTVFSLVCANLRFPTLTSLSELFNTITKKGAVLIFSGIRPEEAASLIQTYRSMGFNKKWQADEKNWTGLVLIKS